MVVARASKTSDLRWRSTPCAARKAGSGTLDTPMANEGSARVGLVAPPRDAAKESKAPSADTLPDGEAAAAARGGGTAGRSGVRDRSRVGLVAPPRDAAKESKAPSADTLPDGEAAAAARGGGTAGRSGIRDR